MVMTIVCGQTSHPGSRVRQKQETRHILQEQVLMTTFPVSSHFFKSQTPKIASAAGDQDITTQAFLTQTLRLFINIVSLTELRIIWEMGPQACLKRIILIILIEVEGHDHCGQYHSLGGILGCIYRERELPRRCIVNVI